MLRIFFVNSWFSLTPTTEMSFNFGRHCRASIEREVIWVKERLSSSSRLRFLRYSIPLFPTLVSATESTLSPLNCEIALHDRSLTKVPEHSSRVRVVVVLVAKSDNVSSGQHETESDSSDGSLEEMDRIHWQSSVREIGRGVSAFCNRKSLPAGTSGWLQHKGCK